MRADVRNTAGFIRDPGAAVTAALLPFSASVKYDGKVCNPLRLLFCCSLTLCMVQPAPCPPVHARLAR